MDKLEEELRDALAKAYIAGATDVHVYWRAGGSDTEPDFAEAAHDYAADHIEASAVIARKRVEEMEAALALWMAYDDQDEADFAQVGPLLIYARAIEATRAALHRKGVEPK